MSDFSRGAVVGDMTDIIMTVKARHIRNMEKGIKRYELRKTRPGKTKGYTVWLCQSGTGGRIVARFDCRTCPEMTNTRDKLIAELCAITEEEVRGYRKGGRQRLFGWLIQGFRRFGDRERALHITDFGLNRPPQSWCYAKEVPHHA